MKTGRRVDGSTRRVDGSTRRVHGFEPWPDTPTPDPNTRPTLTPTPVSGQCQAILTVPTRASSVKGVKPAPTPPTLPTPKNFRHSDIPLTLRHSDTPTLRHLSDPHTTLCADNTSALKCLIEHNTNAQGKLYLEAEALSIKAQMTNLVNGWTVVPSSSVSTRLHRLLLPFSPPSSPLQH